MSNTKEAWFVVERSEALARLLLTSRNDLLVRSSSSDDDDGIDYLVEIKKGGGLSTRLFVVQVKGSATKDTGEWTRAAKQLFRPLGSQVFLPACLFVINLRDNQAAYYPGVKVARICHVKPALRPRGGTDHGPGTSRRP